MSRNKNIINIILVLLLAANAVTLGLFWFKKNLPPPAPEQRGVVEFLSKELNFDQQQQSALKQLVEEHRNSSKELREQLKKEKDEFFNLMKTGKVADSAIEKASYAANETQRKMDISVFKHFQQIRALCNADQQKKFDEIVNDAIQQMRRAPGRPQDGPPPPGEERPGEPPPPHP